MNNSTTIQFEPSDNRSLLIAEIADQFILKGAFNFFSSDETVLHVQEFCSRILAIYDMPVSKLGHAAKLLAFPYSYNFPNLPSAKLFDKSFLEKMVNDIDIELQLQDGKEDLYEVPSRAETFGWRIAVLTAIYRREHSLPSNAYQLTCEAVATAVSLTDISDRSKSLLPLLSLSA